MSVAHKIEEKVRTDDVQISESVDFTGLLLSPSVLEGLTKSGFKRPSPIQLQAIPLGRCGLDLIVQAKSGTGKTCVFTVIALEGLSLQAETLQALILAPTREIAIQIREVVRSIGSCIPELKCHSFIGGTSVQQDKTSLKLCHIATGTPGRIKQLIELGLLKTQSIRLFVLDEADKLLGGDLTESINWIYSSLPDNKQILALSATYPEALAQHLTRYMRNPTFVRLNITDPALIGIKQYHVIVPDCPLPNKVFEAKTEAVIKILSSVSFEQCLIFSNMQTRAQSLQSELQLRNWPTQCIAGCLDQKERSMAMEHLKAYKCRILISTDLTSRGIDADKVNMVINLDVPLDHETYLHRIGRAGRFGSHGAAISIVSKGKQEKELWAVERKCKTHIPKLPDPIPSDLATRYVALKLSDVVTTERIITQTDSLVKLPTSTLNPLPLDNIEQKHKHTVGNCEKNKDNQFNGDCDTGGDKVIEEKCNSDMRREAEENNFDTNRNSNVDKLAESNGKKKSKDNNCDDTKDSVNMAHNREEQTLKKSDPDLCVRSSLELGTTIEDNEDSTSSWVDICSDDQHIKIKFYESRNGGSFAFSQSQTPDSNQVVIQSTVMEKSKYIGEGIGNTLSTQAGKSNGSPDQTGAGVPTQCVQIEMKNGNIKGEDIACTHYTDSKKEVLEIKSVNGGSIVVAENDVKGSLKMADARSIDKTSYEKSSEVLSPSLSNNTVSCDSVNNYDNDKGVGGGGDVSRCGAVCFIPNDNVCSEAEKICTEGSINGNIQEQTTHKAKKQKPPRPFALASFLKGLSESTQDDDTEDSFHSAFSYSTYEREKCSKKIELMANAENRDKEVNDSKLISAKDIEDSESYQSFVSSENEIHSVDDGVISESSGKHEFHKDGKLCEAVKQNVEYDKVKEKSSSLVNEKGASKPVDQEYVVTGKETLVGKEKCPSSSSDRSLHDSKSNVERPSLFPVSRSTWRSFSELQKEFNDCSLAPRKVNMNDICRCICEQLSNLKLQSVRQNRFDVSKITEIREDIRKNIVKAMSERIENPDIVKDFLKTASLSKSSEIQNVRTSTREQPSNNKGDKRKKGSSIQSDEKNVKKRGSDSSNWRSKNPDDDINSVSTGVSSSSHGKKDFDELLKEQLLIKEIKAKCVTEQENKNIDLFSNRAHGNSHVEETNPRIEGATIKPKVSNSHSIGDSDRYGGARPKTYKQPSAATLRDISSLDVISQSSPDVECQMLDQMHMEMLRKRKERKQQKAESAQESSSNGGNQCIQNIPSLDDSRVKSESINSRNYATSEDTCQPLEENKIEVSELAQKSTNIEGNDSIECSSSVENHTGSESVCRNDTICVDKSPLIDCTVDSLLDYSKEYDEKAEFLDKNESLPSQNDRSVCSVQSRRSVVDETELSFTDRMALEKSQSPLSKTHFAVMKFNLSALDLSSESDDLQASLSSCTLVSDICSDFDIGSDSKQTFVARKLAFSEGSNDMTNESSSGHRTNPLNSNKACVVTKQEFLKQAMYTTGQSSPKPCRIRPALEVKCVPREEALTNQPSADRSPPRPMVPPDFESKPSPRVRYISPGRTGGKKQSGKISSSVKSFDRFIRRITKKSKVHTSKVENKNAHLNLSNNKSRDCNRSSISTSSFPCYAGQKHMNIGQSAKYETMVPKYFHQHNQFDKNKSDEEYDDRFAEPSPSNWWPYWFSLYDRYIKGLSWPSSCSTCRYYPCYHGQQQSHPFYVGCPWSCYLCHHHRHLMAYSHHPPYLQSYHSAMTTDFANQCGQLNINSYYDRRAASFQQKYIRHMARVLQEMTSDNS